MKIAMIGLVLMAMVLAVLAEPHHADPHAPHHGGHDDDDAFLALADDDKTRCSRRLGCIKKCNFCVDQNPAPNSDARKKCCDNHFSKTDSRGSLCKLVVDENIRSALYTKCIHHSNKCAFCEVANICPASCPVQGRKYTLPKCLTCSS